MKIFFISLTRCFLFMFFVFCFYSDASAQEKQNLNIPVYKDEEVSLWMGELLPKLLNFNYGSFDQHNASIKPYFSSRLDYGGYKGFVQTLVMTLIQYSQLSPEDNYSFKLNGDISILGKGTCIATVHPDCKNSGAFLWKLSIPIKLTREVKEVKTENSYTFIVNVIRSSENHHDKGLAIYSASF